MAKVRASAGEPQQGGAAHANSKHLEGGGLVESAIWPCPKILLLQTPMLLKGSQKQKEPAFQPSTILKKSPSVESM